MKTVYALLAISVLPLLGMAEKPKPAASTDVPATTAQRDETGAPTSLDTQPGSSNPAAPMTSNNGAMPATRGNNVTSGSEIGR